MPESHEHGVLISLLRWCPQSFGSPPIFAGKLYDMQFIFLGMALLLIFVFVKKQFDRRK
jgi:hypothetical protein